MADGSRRVVKIVKEAVFGTTPSTPTMDTLRNTGGAGIKYDRSSIQSQEMRQDRAIVDVVPGNKKPALELPIELSIESFDDLLEAGLGGVWTPTLTNAVALGSIVASAGTITQDAGDFTTDYSIGDRIETKGFIDDGNNGFWTIDTVVALVITVVDNTNMVDATNDPTVLVNSYDAALLCGLELGSFSVEEGFTDIDSYTMMAGAKVATLSLDVKPDAIITGNFAMLGKSVASPTSSTGATVTKAATTSDVFNSFTGSINEGGSAIATITSLTLELTNNLTPEYVVLQDEAYGIGAGRVEVKGELAAYFADDDLLNKYIDNTETSLVFTLGDSDGNTYTFTMDRVKYTSEAKNIPEGSIIETLGYMALHDTTNTTLKITRAAA